MVNWFAKMARMLDADEDLGFDYVKIARDLDTSGITTGPLYQMCLETQSRLMDLLGQGR
jgi:hypothetical protein